jgi:hypothetical protein
VRDRREAVLAGGILLAALALRVVYAFRYPFDTDEAQHLHVAWGWTRGLVQYRDVFDNHAPLFHLLAAPLVAAIGERPAILCWMRLAVLPLYALSLWATYRLGSALYDARVGRWALVATALFPPFFFSTLEFRADDLWVALWLCSLSVLVGAPLTARRAAGAGLLAGATLAVSLKTPLLLVALGAAAFAARRLAAGRQGHEDRASIAAAPPVLAAMAAGFAVLPGLLALLFAHLGALPDASAGLFGHNAGSAALWDRRGLRIVAFLVQLPLYGLVARSIAARSPSADLAARRATLFLTGALGFATLHGFWPIVTRQDSLPLVPLLVVSAVPFALAALARWEADRPRLSTAALALATAIEVVCLAAAAPPWQDRTRFQIGLVTDVLRLTATDEPVMDLKGETIFRERSFRYAIETITYERMKRGVLADDIAENLVASRTYVAVQDNQRFPAGARSFMNEHYLPVCHVRVAGKVLGAAGPDGSIGFEIAIPGDYTVVSPAGIVAGRLDGAPAGASRFLAPGRHSFAPIREERPLALLWTRAHALGYSPFAPLEDHP